ncbi:MAG: hypothetical protein M5R36_14525 [Deltaproteobacteria bacterium]|nr:hypothetical protein [Deltaproteobacteria bacterium]
MGKHARKLAIPLVLICLGLTLSARIRRPLPLYGHSQAMDAFRQVVYDNAVRHGEIFPRWVPDFYFGHGSPIFQFYAPLPYMMAEPFVLAGFSVPTALKLTLVLAWILSGYFMLALAREYLSPEASFVAAVFYMLAPYHLVDMLVRHAFGEHIAFTWLAMAAAGAVGAARRRCPVSFTAGAFGVALLTLTHNITALIGVPVVAAWAAWESFRARSWERALVGLGAVAAGLGLAAFFWLPAMMETKLVFARESLTREFFEYGQHFVYAKQWFDPAWGFGGSRAGWEEDRLSFQIGLAHWLGIVLAVWAAVRVRRERGKLNELFVPALAIFLAGLLMTHRFSAPLWNLAPLLAFVQFPWRFLVVAAFGASLLAGLGAESVLGDKRLRVPVGACVVALAFYASYTKPLFTVYDTEQNGYIPGPYDLQRDRLDTDPRYADQREHLTIAWVRASGETGSSRDDYLPRTVLEKPTAKEEIASASSGEVVASERAGLNTYELMVSMRAAGRVTLAQFFYPGWRATVDGAEVPVATTSPHGLASVEVPEGELAVRFHFGSTPSRRAAGAVSIVSFALVAAAALLIRRRNRSTRSPVPAK